MKRFLSVKCGWFGHPIFSKSGGYPAVMVEAINRKSQEEGRAWSRLPEMNVELKQYIRGTADFWGLNYYTGAYAEPSPNYGEPSERASYWFDQDQYPSINSSWPQAKSFWLYSVPEGLRGLLKLVFFLFSLFFFLIFYEFKTFNMAKLD